MRGDLGRRAQRVVVPPREGAEQHRERAERQDAEQARDVTCIRSSSR